MRLQKYLALCGVASRRRAEEIILNKRVEVNGKLVTELGCQVEEGDTVFLDGKELKVQEKKRYILYYKPRGEVSTASDEQGRRTVLERFKDMGDRLYPVGRLDINTEGLIILTNDGDFANRLMHPKYEVKKRYLLLMEGFVDDTKLNRLEKGVMVDDKLTAPAYVDLIERNKEETLIEITIHEGRNRQVRKMSEAIGHKPLKLKRTGYAFLNLEGLKSGEYRELSPDEVKRLVE